MRGIDRSCVVDWTTERIDNASDELGSDGDFEHARRAADFIALLEDEIVAEDDGADVVFFEVQGERRDLVACLGGSDFEHLAGHRGGEAIYASNTVLNFEDGTDFFNVQVAEVSRFDFAKKDVLDFAGAESGLGCHDFCVGLGAFWEGNCGRFGACEKYHKPPLAASWAG